jgi:CheY-like chemotaxis protein
MLRVLVVDDDPVVSVAMLRVLRDRYVASASHDPREALGRDLATEYDVILLDLHMPHMSGIEFYARAGAMFPDVQRRIVFISGGALSEAEGELFASVPNVLLQKPFAMENLLEIVRRVAGSATSNEAS